ncbi:hypothetical protein SAMN05444358_1011315 [Ruegeria halocynthiae]|uniref:Uncharacterized protein n=1 Tax=Ruegeria halocynthiae TaxID=985054 RepID=A0A1H2V0E1_9RHOB|nr:hypothetical protein [Ruegeria halocynthiae]SDW61781.1 hypothetical protein SAMN05444358_1011315 [Ruegeria halocynthiae]
MSQEIDIQTRIAQAILLLRKKLGVRDKSLTASVRRARRRLPRKIYKQAMVLAQAEQMADHPRLRFVLDTPKLEQASDDVQSHLNAINLADRRWGWFLSFLGSIALGLLVLSAVAVIILRWRGLI